MFKFDIRTIVLLIILAVVGWTQWKIHSQEITIIGLADSLEKSKKEVSELATHLTDLKEQVRIDNTAVEEWFEKTLKLREDQQGYQAEVKDALSKFRYQMSIDAAKPDTPKASYRIGADITVPAIEGMWKSYNSTLTTITGTNTTTVTRSSEGGTPSTDGTIPKGNP